MPSAAHENMHEMSTDELDAHRKGVCGRFRRQMEIRQGTPLPLYRQSCGRIDSALNLSLRSKRASAKLLDNGYFGRLLRWSTSQSVLVDGSYHDVDSSEMAFKIAGSMAFKEACAKAKPVLLEPIMKVEVVVPGRIYAAGVRLICTLGDRQFKARKTAQAAT